MAGLQVGSSVGSRVGSRSVPPLAAAAATAAAARNADADTTTSRHAQHLRVAGLDGPVDAGADVMTGRISEHGDTVAFATATMLTDPSDKEIGASATATPVTHKLPAPVDLHAGTAAVYSSQSPTRNAHEKTKSSSNRCRLLPHGSYTLLIATLSTVAWIASIVQDGCNYATVTGTGIVNDLRVSSPTRVPPFIELGMEAYREPNRNIIDQGRSERYDIDYSSTCLEYPIQFVENRIDTMWQAARILKFLALVLGGGGSLFIWCSTCFVFSRGTWKILVGYELMLATLCQGAAFLWFFNQVCTDSEQGYVEECRMSWGAKADVLSCALWFFAALLVTCHYPQPKPDTAEYTPADAAVTEDEDDEDYDIEGDYDDDDDDDDCHFGSRDHPDGYGGTAEYNIASDNGDFGEPIHPEREVL